MKDFKDIKIVCCFMAHLDDDWIDDVLENISKYASSIYVNLHDATDYTIKKVKSNPKVVHFIETSDNGARWNQGLQRDNTIRMLDDVKPDIVLFPDSDELYPANFMEQLKSFWEDDDVKTFWFKLLYVWGDREHYRNDGIWKSIHHVRAYKWEPDITYMPYSGYACPTSFIDLAKNTRYNSNAPILHLGYMKPESRQSKYARNFYDYTNDEDFRGKIEKDVIVKKTPDFLKY